MLGTNVLPDYFRNLAAIQKAYAEPFDMGPLAVCVDDDPHVLEALARVLRSYAFRVQCASNGEEALSMLNACPVRVLICDQKMPGMNGIEVLRRAKVTSPHTYRVMLTGHLGEPDVAERAVNEAEIHRLVAKPWKEEDIRHVVAAAMADDSVV